ncbi:hypothetical protein M432DRAFT_637542 [Thermoascus aurantiacus ATCC 26904]
MDETGRKRPLEDDQPASPPSSLTKRPRTQLAAGQRQLGRSSDAESSSSSETSSLSSRDSSDTSSSAEDDSNEESTSSAGTSSSSSSCPSPSSSESDDSEGSEAEEAEDDVDGLDGGHDEAAIEYVPARAKPRIHRVQTDSGILSRVSSFLPKLKAANEDLQRDIAAGRAKDVVMDDVDEEQGEGQYIEMNLGLGVLEEKRSHDGSESSSEESESSVSDGGRESPAITHPKTQKDTNVLGRLMGNRTKPKKPGIEEIND